MTLPSVVRLSLVRTNAGPLPGLTCWNSTILKIIPSTSMWVPFLNWLVLITPGRLASRISDICGRGATWGTREGRVSRDQPRARTVASWARGRAGIPASPFRQANGEEHGPALRAGPHTVRKQRAAFDRRVQPRPAGPPARARGGRGRHAQAAAGRGRAATRRGPGTAGRRARRRHARARPRRRAGR